MSESTRDPFVPSDVADAARKMEATVEEDNKAKRRAFEAHGTMLYWSDDFYHMTRRDIIDALSGGAMRLAPHAARLAPTLAALAERRDPPETKGNWDGPREAPANGHGERATPAGDGLRLGGLPRVFADLFRDAMGYPPPRPGPEMSPAVLLKTLAHAARNCHRAGRRCVQNPDSRAAAAAYDGVRERMAGLVDAAVNSGALKFGVVLLIGDNLAMTCLPDRDGDPLAYTVHMGPTLRPDDVR